MQAIISFLDGVGTTLSLTYPVGFFDDAVFDAFAAFEREEGVGKHMFPASGLRAWLVGFWEKLEKDRENILATVST